VLLGPVETPQTTAVLIAERRHAGRFLYFPDVDPRVLEKTLAAADYACAPGPLNPDTAFFVLAMHNGIVPLAEHCSGLRELVIDFDPSTGAGNGLVSYRQGIDALADAIRRALYLPEGERAILSSRAREIDLTWDACAARLTTLAKRLTGTGARSAA
jgi:glycogen synthase